MLFIHPEKSNPRSIPFPEHGIQFYGRLNQHRQHGRRECLCYNRSFLLLWVMVLLSEAYDLLLCTTFFFFPTSIEFCFNVKAVPCHLSEELAASRCFLYIHIIFCFNRFSIFIFDGTLHLVLHRFPVIWTFHTFFLEHVRFYGDRWLYVECRFPLFIFGFFSIRNT